MTRNRVVVFAAAWLLAFSPRSSLHAGSDVFLDLGPGLPGESVDRVHASKVEVLSWGWGLANGGAATAGGSGSPGRASFQDLCFTKYVDRASPKLMALCATAGHLPTATLIGRTTGPNPVEYLKITLDQVVVRSVSVSGVAGQDRLTEDIALNFAKVSLTYLPADNARPQAGINFAWDLPRNSGGDSTVPSAPPRPVRGLTPTLTYTNGAPFATLTWLSTAASNYQVWVATDADGVFRRYGSPIPSAGDVETSLTVPANLLREFFRIETLPRR